jgi:hypothetical protein
MLIGGETPEQWIAPETPIGRIVNDQSRRLDRKPSTRVRENHRFRKPGRLSACTLSADLPCPSRTGCGFLTDTKETGRPRQVGNLSVKRDLSRKPARLPIIAEPQNRQADALPHRPRNRNQRNRAGVVLQQSTRAVDESLERAGRVPVTESYPRAQARTERQVSNGQYHQSPRWASLDSIPRCQRQASNDSARRDACKIGGKGFPGGKRTACGENDRRHDGTRSSRRAVEDGRRATKQVGGVGLCKPRESALLQPFIKRYIDGRTDVKSATK